MPHGKETAISGINQKRMDKLTKTTDLPIWRISPKEYSKEVTKQNLTVEDAIKSPTPHLSVLIKIHSEAEVKAVLVLMLVEHIKFFNVGKSMNETQVVQTVNLILSEYSGYKLEDFAVCFKNRKLGKYGKLYDVLDGSIIMQDLAFYDNERMNFIYTKHEEDRGKLGFIEYIPEDIKEELDKILPKTRFTIGPIESKQSEIDRKCNEIYREFDQLYREQKRNDGSVRMIEYEGQVMDVYTFISKKLEL